MAKGVPGYVQAEIAVTVNPAAYTGGGISGWSGGTTYTFAVRERRPRLTRQDQTTTDSAYESRVGGPVGVELSVSGYWKGTGYPPDDITDEFIYVTCETISEYNGVFLVRSFEEIGSIDGAVNYTLDAASDGTFTRASQGTL